MRKYPTFFVRTLTVGFGISPNRGLSPFADCTAGEEFRLAPKFIFYYYNDFSSLCQLFTQGIYNEGKST